MSEQTQNNQMLVMGLVVIAVLLAVIAGVIVVKQNNALPPVTAPATSANTPAAGAAGGAAGAAAGGTAGQAAAPVDPKSATKVPKDTTPEAFVKAYYESCEKGDWQAAFDKLPAPKKQGNSPDALKEQVSGYGIKSFTVVGATAQGDKMQVTAEQVTGSYGTFVNTWTFEKKAGVWYAADKAVTGMK